MTNPHPLVDSNILNGLLNGELVYNVFPFRRPKFKLLYRASRDGKDGPSFHKKVNGKGSTLTIIMAKNNRIFGVYNHINQTSDG